MAAEKSEGLVQHILRRASVLTERLELELNVAGTGFAALERGPERNPALCVEVQMSSGVDRAQDAETDCYGA